MAGEPVGDDGSGIAIDERLVGAVFQVDAQRSIRGGDAGLGRADACLDLRDAPLERLRPVDEVPEAHLRQRLEGPIVDPGRARRDVGIERVRRQPEVGQELLSLLLGQRRQAARAHARRRVRIGRRQLRQDRLQAATQRRRLADGRLRRLQIGAQPLHLGELRAQLRELLGAVPRQRATARRDAAGDVGVDGAQPRLRRVEAAAERIGGGVDVADPIAARLLELRDGELELAERHRLAAGLGGVVVVHQRAEAADEVGVQLIDLEVEDVGELDALLDDLDAQRLILDAVDERARREMAGVDEAASLDEEGMLRRDPQLVLGAVVVAEDDAHERALAVDHRADDGAQAAHAAVRIARPDAVADDQGLDRARPRVRPHRRAGDEAGLFRRRAGQRA